MAKVLSCTLMGQQCLCSAALQQHQQPPSWRLDGTRHHPNAPAARSAEPESAHSSVGARTASAAAGKQVQQQETVVLRHQVREVQAAMQQMLQERQ